MEGEELLLDTQVLLWILAGSERIETKSFKEIVSGASFSVNQTSIWEIQIKYDLGKLSLPRRPGKWLLEAIDKSGIRYKGISDEAIFTLGKLPMVHRDPFDRLIVAHALVERQTLVTSDMRLEDYPIDVLFI